MPVKRGYFMPTPTDLTPHISGNQLAIYAIGAALILVILFKIPYVGRVIRGLFSFALLAFGIYLVLQQAPVLSRDRKSVVQGKSVSVRVALGGRRIITKTTLYIHLEINKQTNQ